MKIRSKEPYWLLRNGIINTYPSLQNNIQCDALIVGAGITGALIAFQLAYEGYKIVVIDKRDVATGSTCATTAMIQYEIDEPLYGLIESKGKEAANEIYRAGIEAIEKLEEIVKMLPSLCSFQTQQSLHFASTLQDADGLQREYECRRAAGINVRWCSKKDIHRHYGVESEGGILSQTAASVDPYQLTHAIFDHIIQKFGVEIYDHTALTSVEYYADKNTVTVDTGATISSKFIAYATGYETHELMSSDIGKLISTYACVSEPLPKIPKALCDTLFWNTQDPYFYFRITHDNRILIGGEDENFINPEKRDGLILDKENDLVEKFLQCRPDLKFIPDFSWAGTFGVKDTLPYIGPHPDFPNSYFLLGFGGNGITFSLMGMKMVSDAIANRENKFLNYFKFNR